MPFSSQPGLLAPGPPPSQLRFPSLRSCPKPRVQPPPGLFCPVRQTAADLAQLPVSLQPTVNPTWQKCRNAQVQKIGNAEIQSRVLAKFAGKIFPQIFPDCWVGQNCMKLQWSKCLLQYFDKFQSQKSIWWTPTSAQTVWIREIRILKIPNLSNY